MIEWRVYLELAYECTNQQHYTQMHKHKQLKWQLKDKITIKGQDVKITLHETFTMKIKVGAAKLIRRKRKWY